MKLLQNNGTIVYAIFRGGGNERLIKENILHSLIFDDEKCIDCIKGKYPKKIKKGANRSQGVLEIIHTDICGPFNVKSVDGFDFIHNIH